MEATTFLDNVASRPLYMYLSIPFKKPESASTSYETIMVIARAEADTRVQFYKTGSTLLAANTTPNFSNDILE